MTKKLIALVEVLMVLSLFSTGFASWLIMVPGVPASWNYQTDASNAYQITAVRYNPSYFGVSLTDNVNGTAECDTFCYSTVKQAGKTDVNVFTSTTLSVLIQIDQTKMNHRLELGDYRDSAVLINCSTQKSGFTYAIAGSSNSWQKNGLVYPDTCKLTLRGYPNLYIMGTVSPRTSDGSLDITIPVEQLYNLAALDKVSLSNTAQQPPIYIKLELEFTDTGYASAQIPTPCGYVPVFTVQTTDKA